MTERRDHSAPRRLAVALLVGVASVAALFMAAPHWGSDETARKIINNLTAEERRAISRGPLTLADHEAFVSQTTSCLREKGYTVSETKLADGRTAFSTSISGSGDDRSYDQCSKLSEGVRSVWLVDHPSRWARFGFGFAPPHLDDMVEELRE